jgi:hypothetical protein
LNYLCHTHARDLQPARFRRRVYDKRLEQLQFIPRLIAALFNFLGGVFYAIDTSRQLGTPSGKHPSVYLTIGFR